MFVFIFSWTLGLIDCLYSYHLVCLTPPLRNIPIGDWFCPRCSVHSTNIHLLNNEEGQNTQESRHNSRHDDIVDYSQFHIISSDDEMNEIMERTESLNGGLTHSCSLFSKIE